MLTVYLPFITFLMLIKASTLGLGLFRLAIVQSSPAHLSLQESRDLPAWDHALLTMSSASNMYNYANYLLRGGGVGTGGEGGLLPVSLQIKTHRIEILNRPGLKAL